MKKIENKIVYSNDIVRILKGNNALNFNLERKGFKIPNQTFFNELRSDFLSNTNKIFNNKVMIIEEDEMVNGIINGVKSFRRYPHRIFG